MAVEVTLKDVEDLQSSILTLKDNNDKIEQAFFDAVSRTNPVNNSMLVDLDMGNRNVLNVKDFSIFGKFSLNGVDLAAQFTSFVNAAEAARDLAQNAQQAAESSASIASASAESAVSSANAASASATESADSALASQASADSILNAEANSAASAEAAATSEANAASSAAAAAASEVASASSAAASATSATESATSATESATSATESANSASASATSATAAQTAESGAQVFRDQAEVFRDEAEALVDEIDVDISLWYVSGESELGGDFDVGEKAYFSSSFNQAVIEIEGPAHSPATSVLSDQIVPDNMRPRSRVRKFMGPDFAGDTLVAAEVTEAGAVRLRYYNWLGEPRSSGGGIANLNITYLIPDWVEGGAPPIVLGEWDGEELDSANQTTVFTINNIDVLETAEVVLSEKAGQQVSTFTINNIDVAETAEITNGNEEAQQMSSFTINNIDVA